MAVFVGTIVAEAVEDSVCEKVTVSVGTIVAEAEEDSVCEMVAVSVIDAVKLSVLVSEMVREKDNERLGVEETVVVGGDPVIVIVCVSETLREVEAETERVFVKGRVLVLRGRAKAN